MTKRVRRGPISKDIKDLCTKLILMNGNEAEFKEGIEKLLLEYSYLGELLFHDIATSLRKWAVDCSVKDMDRIWKLTDQVDLRISQSWYKFENDFFESP